VSDELKQAFGKTFKVKFADEKEYILREPCIEALEEIQLDLNKLDEIKTIKKLVWLLAREDNAGLTEAYLGRIITLSMMREGSSLMDAIKFLMGSETKGDSSKKG